MLEKIYLIREEIPIKVNGLYEKFVCVPCYDAKKIT